MGLNWLLLVGGSFAFQKGDWVCATQGLNLRKGACGPVLFAAVGAERGQATAVTPLNCSLGNYTWVTFARGEGGEEVTGAAEAGLSVCNPPNVGKVLSPAPYVSQRYDVGNAFDGDWACGPTSALMSLAYYKLLPPRPLQSNKPWNHTNSYGWYDFNNYTSATGHHFDRVEPDPNKKPFMGAWGSCTDGGGAVADQMQSYINNHGTVKAVFFSAIQFSDVKAAIDKGHVVVLDTLLSSVGHLVLARGYSSTGNVIVNDPWGNKNQANWGMAPNGEEVEYTPEDLALGKRWALEVMPLSDFRDEDWEPEALKAPAWARSGGQLP
jgi:hypothetical protein